MKNPHAVALGSIKSKKKAQSSQENGKMGGRPLLKNTLDEKLKKILQSRQPVWKKQEEIMDIIEEEKKMVFKKTKVAYKAR